MLMGVPARAQSAAQPQPAAAVQVNLGNSAVALTDWRFHPGDNPDWALPGYDDSGWTIVDLSGAANAHDPTFSSDSYVPGWTAMGFPTLSGYAWYRTRFQVTGDHRDLWLEMPPNFDDIYQVYVNGKYVGEYGNLTPHHIHDIYSRSTKFKLPPIEANGGVLLALRFYMDADTPQWNPQAGGLHSPPVIGLVSTITLLQARNSTVNLHTFLAYLLLAIALAMAGIAALWIFMIDREEHAYLWLTLAFLLGAVSNLAEFSGSQMYWLTISMELLIRDFVGAVLIPLFWLLFWAHWFRLRRLRLVVRAGWVLAFLELCVFACMRHYLLASLLPEAWAHPVWLASVALRIAFALLLLAVTVAGIRQDPAEGWPALPAIVLLGVGLFFIDFQTIGVQVTYYPLDIRVGLDIIAWFVLAVIVVGLVLRRFLRTQVQQQELAQEMEQAHAVQSLLVPERLPQTPGYRVDGTYIPASQVGGDFYQVLPVLENGKETGSATVVLGDVSGKGLRAAMVVSMAVGAVRAIVKETTDPAEVLLRLNAEIAGHLRNGFITCLCLRLDPDGSVTVANAGHLPPWLNGKEVAMPGAVPLGMIANPEYEAQSFLLRDRDVLVVMSDGIVEARNEKDGELYGFDRLAALLGTKPTADEIARAAQRFGQEDDISVVSIARIAEGIHAV